MDAMRRTRIPRPLRVVPAALALLAAVPVAAPCVTFLDLATGEGPFGGVLVDVDPDYVRSRLSDLGRSRKPEHPYDPAVFDQVASRMRDDVTGWGGTLLFAYLPDRTRFEDSSTANPQCGFSSSPATPKQMRPPSNC